VRYLRWLLTFMVALYFAMLAIKNNSLVSLDLWPFDLRLQMSLPLFLCITFILGAMIGGALVWWSSFIKRWKQVSQPQPTAAAPTSFHEKDQ
jgi:uncharacterized integral membrane protein